jgi:hypothetical protein
MATLQSKTEYTLDETGKIASLTINGKPAKAGFMRGLTKAQNCGYWQLQHEGGYAQNPFSGVLLELTALELSIYNWTLNWYSRYERGIMTPPIQTYDDMKYLLLEINPTAYMELID